jgi:hypothetical protein
MGRRIAAITFILACTTVAWAILGTTIFARTYDSRSGNLKRQVQGNWGTAQSQHPPQAWFTNIEFRSDESTEGGKKVVRKAEVRSRVDLPLEATRAKVGLDLEHRQKGLLWFSTYRVGFAGDYHFRNPSDREQAVTFTLPLPAKTAIYDNLVLSVDGASLPIKTSDNSASGTARIGAGKTALLQVGYRSNGIDRWEYNFGENVEQVRDFELRMRTNFKDIDFPENTISATERRRAGDGWELTWAYQNLLSGFPIAMAMPEKLQPGPMAGQISYFAPVSLLFFFFMIFFLTTIRGIPVHPMNYFFLACAFFAFHLLLAYLVDHISIHAAFAISSVVSMFLVISYLRLVVGMRFAAVEAGLAQLVYLVLFSYAFFFKGFTGLAVTIGAIISLFVVMQMTGRIRWDQRFGAVPRTA